MVLPLVSSFVLQFLRAGFRPLHAPEGGVAMPSLSEGNLDLKIGYLGQGSPENPKSVVYNQKVLNPHGSPNGYPTDLPSA